MVTEREWVLVTGGAGYVGSATVQELIARKKYSVVVLDNLEKGHREFIDSSVEFVEGNISDAVILADIFRKYPIKTVLHFAAYSLVGESTVEPLKYYENNVIGTISLLKAMRESGCNSIVFSSSAAVYGIPACFPIEESEALRPINPYGKTKKIVEDILQDFDSAYGIRSVSLRYFNAAGSIGENIGEDHFPETHLIPRILDVALGKSYAVEVFGTDYDTPDGTCIRDYIHVKDLATAHVAAVEYLAKNNNSEIINLGQGIGYSVREIIEVTKKVVKSDIKVVESSRRAGDPAVLIASNSKARELLNWLPIHSDLDLIISSAWLFHKKRFSQ